MTNTRTELVMAKLELLEPAAVRIGDHIAYDAHLRAYRDGQIPYQDVCVAEVHHIEEEDGAFRFWCDDIQGPNFVDWDDDGEFDDEGNLTGKRTGCGVHTVPHTSKAPIMRYEPGGTFLQTAGQA